MKILYVYHCMGLGDTIICNGIINNCTTKFDKVVIFCKPQFYPSISFLYRNNDKVFIIKADDAQAGAIFDNILHDTKIKVGFGNIPSDYKFFDESFYNQVGLNFNKRWSDFRLERDLTKEQELFDKLNPGDDYAFVHENIALGHIIPTKDIESRGLKVFRPDSNHSVDNIFLYGKIIENAKEIHCVCSSFKNYIDSMTTIKSKLYFYPNRKDTFFVSSSKLNWEVR